MPQPTAVKTTKIIAGLWLSPKPTAVPRKGAEQGVASRVANRPAVKWPARPSPPEICVQPAMRAGSGTSKSPHRLRLKSVTTRVRKTTKTGSWN